MKSKYSAEEKFQIVMESFSDNVTQAEICRRHGIYPVQQTKWRGRFILGGRTTLAQRRNSDSRDEDIHDLKKIIGDQCCLFFSLFLLFLFVKIISNTSRYQY